MAKLGQFREKCNDSSKENCAGCVAKRVSPQCFMRLLALFDPSYHPSPHHGHEFGDYHRMVTLDGLPNVQLLTAMKSSQPAKTTVKLRHDLGKDIYSQVATYRKDATVGLVGILVPRRLEAGFKALLRTDAEQSNKKLVFFEEGEVVRIVHSVLKRRDLSFDDL